MIKFDRQEHSDSPEGRLRVLKTLSELTAMMFLHFDSLAESIDRVADQGVNDMVDCGCQDCKDALSKAVIVAVQTKNIAEMAKHMSEGGHFS